MHVLLFACREVPIQCDDEFGFIAEMGQIIAFGDEHDTRQVELRPDRSSQGADARFILWRLAARGSES